MAYRFKRKESISVGVARILRQRTESSLDALCPDKPGIDRGIHDARKNFKKIRSLLRLIRSELASEDFQQANQGFRQAGRRLSDVRDAKVMLDAFDLLMKLYPVQAKKHHMYELRINLMARVQSGEGVLAQSNKRVKEVAEVLRTMPDVTLGGSLETHDFSVIEGGFKRAYQGGQRAMKRALGSSKPEDFHEWRKRAKDHWYHTLLLRNCCTDFMRSRRVASKELAVVLGDYNDLSTLQTLCHAALSSRIDKRYHALERLARKRQRVLRKKAVDLGNRIYEQKPRDLSRLVARHWVGWKQDRADQS